MALQLIAPIVANFALNALTNVATNAAIKMGLENSPIGSLSPDKMLNQAEAQLQGMFPMFGNIGESSILPVDTEKQ